MGGITAILLHDPESRQIVIPSLPMAPQSQRDFARDCCPMNHGKIAQTESQYACSPKAVAEQLWQNHTAIGRPAICHKLVIAGRIVAIRPAIQDA